MEDFKPNEYFQIDDLETLRTMADPLRMQIYEILLQAPANVRQVAERLGLASSRLYYHFNLMEKFGLIRVVETRMVANMMEKSYRAIAYKLDVADNLMNFETDEGKTAVTELLTSGLDTTREDLLRSLQARMFDLEQGVEKKTRTVLVNRSTAYISDHRAKEFNERLRALIAEFNESDVPRETGEEGYHDYAMMIAMYPSFYYHAGRIEGE